MDGDSVSVRTMDWFDQEGRSILDTSATMDSNADPAGYNAAPYGHVYVLFMCTVACVLKLTNLMKYMFLNINYDAGPFLYHSQR